MVRRVFAVAGTTVALALGACGGSTTRSHGPTGSSPVTGAPSTTPASTAPTTTAVPADAGTWSLIPDGPFPAARPVAWTGNELLVARAACCDDLGSVDLGAYDPAANTWRKLPVTPLTPRDSAAGAWTGTEMVAAGGRASADGTAEHAAPVTDGAAWNAATNTWHPIAAMPTTLAGRQPTAVWTGREVLVWSSVPDNPGAKGREVVLAYDPAADRWRALPASGLTPRQDAVTVWTGTELVVWGGLNQDLGTAFGDGARLDPVTGTWRRLPTAPVPARGMAAATWSGQQVLLWGGVTGPGAAVGQGAAYDPVSDRWRALPPSPLRAKYQPAGVWTGRLFLVIGGAADSGLPAPGPGAAAYDPSADSWTPLPAAPPYPPAPGTPTWPADQRADGLAVWTGKAAVLVGGQDFRQQAGRADGVAWTPAG